MNKAELVEAIYEYVDREVTKKDITLIVSSLFDTIANTVAKNEKVTVVGFGAFEKRDRAARRGRNPKSGEIMEIPAMSVPAFSAGKNFKELVATEELLNIPNFNEDFQEALQEVENGDVVSFESIRR